MHFFKVPRLGSYIAVRLEYESCLNEKALDEGVADMQRVVEAKAKQEEEKAEHQKVVDEEQAAWEANSQAEGDYAAPDKEWEVIEPNAYEKVKVSFVVCLNTCG